MAQTSNINTRSRLTQVIVLITVILCVVLFSQVARAQGPNQHVKFHKEAKYRIAVHKSGSRTCQILHKKRMSMSRHGLFASNKPRTRNTNREALAETEEPVRTASVN